MSGKYGKKQYNTFPYNEGPSAVETTGVVVVCPIAMHVSPSISFTAHLSNVVRIGAKLSPTISMRMRL